MTSSTDLKTSTQVANQPPGEKPFPPFDSANFVSLFIWLVITFGILYLLMWRLGLPRVETILKDRRRKIDDDLGAAFAQREAADRASAEYQKTLAEARTHAQTLAQETHGRLAAEADAKRHALETDLAGKLAAAEAQIETTKAKAMASVDQIAREAAASIVEHITGKPADPTAIAAALKT